MSMKTSIRAEPDSRLMLACDEIGRFKSCCPCLREYVDAVQLTELGIKENCPGHCALASIKSAGAVQSAPATGGAFWRMARGTRRSPAATASRAQRNPCSEMNEERRAPSARTLSDNPSRLCRERRTTPLLISCGSPIK